ncbi:DHH family phosphoesterase [Raoultibacter phocaeensis]|uniref:DHH family phosphoesterase n=1 Tax=Raoultibacter phocaeensis TaxID=2479841 RepID=UPI00111848F2|nr:bifunctional oligoribonuclease/PAP phosphatase NrnA [Raoultibacter phocaeensis]
MAVTPQTNSDLAGIAEALRTAERFAVCGHVSPDGDCLGSQLVVYHALRTLGKDVTCLLAKPDPIEAGLLFLPGIEDMVPAADYDGAPDVFIAVDVPTPERMGAAAAAVQARSQTTVTIDHHAADDAMSTYTFVDPDAASTTMLVWELAGLLGIERSPEMATCAYTGLVTDTGRFQFQNTDQAAFAAAFEMVQAGADPAAVAREVFQNRSIASLELEGIALARMRFGMDGAYVASYLTREDFEKTGAVKSDAEPLINTIRAVAGIRVACMLREEPEHVRGSFRAKDDTDVAAIARTMGGGGHRAAAGFTLYDSLDQAIERVDAAVAAALGASGPSGDGSAQR